MFTLNTTTDYFKKHVLMHTFLLQVLQYSLKYTVTGSVTTLFSNLVKESVQEGSWLVCFGFFFV